MRPACSPPFLAGVRCVGMRAGPGSRQCPALLGCVVGVRFLCFFFCACLGLALWCRLLAVPVLGLVVPVPPFPFLRAGQLALFFFLRGVCLHVSVSPFPVGRCFWLGVAGFCWVVPLCLFWGSCLRCLLGGGFGRLLWCWRAVWWLWAVLSPPPLPPLFFSFWGGSACSSLCLPWAGARTGPHSVWSSGLLLAVACCLAVSRPHGPGGLCERWARRPPPAGLGPGSAGWAAAPGGCVWLLVRGLGLSVSFHHCGAGFNHLGGPPPLLPGARWPRVWPAVPVCGVLVRCPQGCPVACFG